MRLRFRLGPFTFGKGGTRLSVWSGGTGVSVPLSKKKKSGTFGKVNVGPVSAYFNDSSSSSSSSKKRKIEKAKQNQNLSSPESSAIINFGADHDFKERILKHGVPWRGVQERLKEELPNGLPNINDAAFKLVPKAMDDVFGPQNIGWKTEKRPSKSGKGQTTWIVAIKPDA